MAKHRTFRAISNYFRSKRDKRLRALIAACPRSGERLEILDLGGRCDYWKRVGYDFLQSQAAHITLLNLHEGELTIDEEAPNGLFELKVGDARALDLAANSFDLCHSNSVIEHVGKWEDMAGFARETRRLANSYYVQSPNYWFPIDPHFAAMPMIHWMPLALRVWLHQRLPLAHAGRASDHETALRYANSARLLSRRQMRKLFPEAQILSERFIMLAKSHIAIHIGETAGAQIQAGHNQQRTSHG